MEEKKISIFKLDNRITGVYKILFVCFVILLLGYFKTAGYIGYETNDDLFMSAISAGWYGKYYPYTIHNNIVVGYILSFLSSQFYVFNWTTILSIVLIFISYYLFGAWSIEKNGGITGSLLASIFVLVTWIPIINRNNYTKTGALAIAVGVVIILGDYIDCGEKITKNIRTGMAVMLLVTGSLLRYKTSLALLPFILLGVICSVKRHEKRKTIVFIVVITTTILLWIGDYCVYHLNREWRDYKEYNNIREELLDYNIPEYQSNKQIFENLGLSENDYMLLSTWQYADDKVFSKDVMNQLLEYREKNDVESFYDKIVRTTYNIANIFTTYKFLYAVLVIMIFSIWNAHGTNRYILLICLSLWFAELILICYKGRMPERAIIIPTIMCMGFSALFYTKKKYSNALLFGIVVVALLTCGWINKREWNNSRDAIVLEDDSREIFKIIAKQKDKLFVWNIGSATYNLMLSHDSFSPFAFGEHSNSVYTGGWLVPSPIMSDISGKFGEKNNVYKLLADNPNVLYVSFNSDTAEENIKMIESYIREHYNENASAINVGEYGIYVFYSFCNSEQ